MRALLVRWGLMVLRVLEVKPDPEVSQGLMARWARQVLLAQVDHVATPDRGDSRVLMVPLVPEA